MMSDPPAREHGGKLIGRPAVFPWAATGREVDVATPVLVEKPGIVLVGHIVDRIIEIEVVVVHPVHRVAHVVNAGERVAALHAVGMLEEGVGRVIGTERCAVGGDRDARRLALGVDEWEDFAGDIVVYCACSQLRWKGCAPLLLNESLWTPLMEKNRIRPSS